MRYLQDFKIGKMTPYDQAVDALSSIKSLSKTDAVNLLKHYGVTDCVYPVLEHQERGHVRGLRQLPEAQRHGP